MYVGETSSEAFVRVYTSKIKATCEAPCDPNKHFVVSASILIAPFVGQLQHCMLHDII